jgi:triacylglycerol lipase
MGQTSLGRWLAYCGLLFLPVAAQAAVTPAPSGDGRCVLLVHGIYDNPWSMIWLRRSLEERGWRVEAVSIEPNDGSIPFEAMARQVADFVDAHFSTGEKFDLVGFSMGGLISRYYVQKLGGAARVRRLVTISAPNHGTIWAWLSGRSGVREMRPGSEMLRELNEDAGSLAALDYTSIYTPLDLTIFPAASSRMPVGRNIIAWVPLHPLMVMLPQPRREVERALQ